MVEPFRHLARGVRANRRGNDGRGHQGPEGELHDASSSRTRTIRHGVSSHPWADAGSLYRRCIGGKGPLRKPRDEEILAFVRTRFVCFPDFLGPLVDRG